MARQGEYILAIDQGTFSTRGIVFNDTGSTIASAQQPVSLKRIDQHRIEQDAVEILQSVQHVINAILADNRLDNTIVSRAGLTTQRSSIVAWRPSSGRPISPVLSWQDTRGSDWLARFSVDTPLIQRHTGLRLSPHYGVSKIKWLLNNNPDVKQAMRQKDCVITPLASFIQYSICPGHDIQIDCANAARTLLCNLLLADWDDKLIELFSIDRNILPRIRPIRFPYGQIGDTKIDLHAINGDQNAAMYSNGSPAHDSLTLNLGTGAFVLCPVTRDQIRSSEVANSGLLCSISDNDHTAASFYIEGTVNGAGAAIQWLEERFDARARYDLQELPSANHLFINSIGGLGSPLWRHDIEPVFVNRSGETIEVSFDEALPAVIESIVFLLQINIDRVRGVQRELHTIHIGGGLSRNEAITQWLADLSGLTVERYAESEASARGIAWLAASDRSNWQSQPLLKSYTPQRNTGLRQRYRQFRDYLQSRYHVEGLSL